MRSKFGFIFISRDSNYAIERRYEFVPFASYETRIIIILSCADLTTLECRVSVYSKFKQFCTSECIRC